MAETEQIENKCSDRNSSAQLHQLEIHPEVLKAVNVEAFEWLFSNKLSPDVLFDRIELNSIPVVRKKGGRINQRYLVIGSIIEFFWLVELAPFRSMPSIPINVKESFDFRKSLGSLAFDTWAKNSGPGSNAVSAALFEDVERLRMENRWPTMANDHLSSMDRGNISRLKRFTGFDSRALLRSGELKNIPITLQKFVCTQLGLKFDLEPETSKGENVDK